MLILTENTFAYKIIIDSSSVIRYLSQIDKIIKKMNYQENESSTNVLFFKK